jgi:hypothetical protein
MSRAAGAAGKGRMACLAVLSCPSEIGKCPSLGRPGRKGRERQKTEQHGPNFVIANPDTMPHACTPEQIFFLLHRPPPFNEITLISSSNEPPIGERTRNRSPSVAGSSSSLFAGVSFDNVTIISPPPFLNFLRENYTTI